MKKYLTKVRCSVFVAFMAFFIIVNNFFLNFAILDLKPSIEDISGKLLKSSVNIGNIYYLFPNMLAFENVQVLSSLGPQDDQVIYLPRAVCWFSIWTLLTKGSMSLDRIQLEQPRAERGRLYSLFRLQGNRIISFLRQMPSGDIEVKLKNGYLYHQDENSPRKEIPYNLYVGIKGKSVLAKGDIGQTRLYLLGNILKNEFLYKKLEISRDDFYLNLWGSTAGNISQLKGYTFVGRLLNEKSPQDGIYRKIQGTRSLITNRMYLSKFEDQSKINLYILDIDTRFKTSVDSVDVDHLWLSLNQNPLQLKGRLDFKNSLSYDVKCFLKPHSQKKEKSVFQGAWFEMAGQFQDRVLKGRGNAKVHVTKNGDHNSPFREIRVDFDDLISNFNEYPQAHVAIGRSQWRWDAGAKDEHSLVISGIESFLSMQDQKSAQFYLPIYGGSLRGQVFIDKDQESPQIVSNINLTDIDIDKIEGLSIDHAKVGGKVSADVSFNTYPSLYMNGDLQVQNGHLSNFSFLDTLAGKLGQPKLKSIEFERLFSNFTINPSQITLDRIVMNTDEFDISGDVKLKNRETLTSQFSLAVQRDYLSESRQFRPLVGLVRQDVNPLQFDFQFAGKLNSMNFRWLKSNLKDDLQKRIPNYIERQIERQIERSFQIENNNPL